jgi:O-antigen/teichoic acid export membrane protein
MSDSNMHRQMVRNTISNYVRTVAAMFVGLLTFRLLYQHFDKEEFGFWSLLWSVFGYGILLDFGFGFAAQKRVAELSVKQQWDELGHVLSSIIVFYTGVAVVLAGGVLLASPWLMQWAGVSASRAEEFRLVLIVFFVGIGLAFPLGIFPEILRGQQRISLANWLTTGALVTRLILIIVALWQHWSFLAIMCIALGSALAPDVISAFFAMRSMPQVKLRPSWPAFRSMRHTMAFSLFAYLGTATNLVLGKTDQLVITTTLGVAAIALYQSGAKVAEVFREFTKQVQDTLSPVAAHLHAGAQHEALRSLLIQGTRWSVLIATPLYLMSAFYLDELLQLLTGDAALSHETWLVGQVLLAWYYTTILTHSVSKRIFIMTGHERKLMWLGLAEAGANLVISVVLVLWLKSVAAVALGSLIPTLWFGWAYLWPWQARESGLSSVGLFKKAVLPAWAAAVPVLLVLLTLKTFTLAPGNHDIAAMFIEGSLTGLVAIASLWRLAMSDAERERVLRRLRLTPSTPSTIILPA